MKNKETTENYGEFGRNIDYINRVLASFAEIYNYDYTKSALFEGEQLRQNGYIERLRAHITNSMNKEKKNIKMFYNETTFKEIQKEEYGFLNMGHIDASTMADMIAMAVRIVEAFGIHHIIVNIKAHETIKPDLFRYLDCLDIEYNEKELNIPDFDKVSFEISKQNEDEKDMVLIQGGSLEKKVQEMSKSQIDAFAIFGDINHLLAIAMELGNIKTEEKILDIVVTYETELEKEHTLYLVQELRLNGFKTEIDNENLSKEELKKQYRTRYSIILKEADIKNDEVELIDLDTNETSKIKEMDLINHLDINF